jgi:L-iditol 2-dehydrogenase
MKAIVIERPNEVAYTEVETPAVGPDDVLIRSNRAGLCRTDLEILLGEIPEQFVRYPCIPGHEWSGTIAEVGGNVSDMGPGDRVVAEGMVPCNRCRRCKNGETNLCENYDQLGFTRGGGCGEFVLAPRHVVHRVSDHVSFDSAVLVEPAACVFRALERVRPMIGETIGVIGIGTLGSIAVQLARLFGARDVIAYGLREEELEFARRMGATRVVNVGESDPQGATLDALGEGLDVVVETAGSPQAIETALSVVRSSGRVALLGISGDKRLDVPADTFVWKDVHVAATMSYTTAVWSKVLRLVEAKMVDFDSIVTHRFPAEDFRSAYSLMDNREGLVAKIVLEHSPA